MLLLIVLGAGLLLWKFEIINVFYFKNQLTLTGLVINGAIILLFILGLLKVIALYLSYMREEAALLRFVRNIEIPKNTDLLEGLPARSLMARRYRTLRRLHDARTPINQGALASTLVASESTRTSFPKFINNILILTGVFGTIVSLSIALIGASNLLENAVNVGGMGLVVHGMSTALSTTITAIVCFVFLTYFNIKLTDIQTNLVSGIEQVTATFLVPRFQIQTESVLYEFTGLIRSLQGLVHQMEKTQEASEEINQQLTDTIGSYKGQIDKMSDNMGSIKHILRAGFRLGDNA